MKKLRLLILSIYMSFSFAACTQTDIPPEDTSLPIVDIVERSALVDRINIHYIINQQYAQKLARQGLNVDFDGFELSADNAAVFDLVLKNAEGRQLTLPINTLVNYEKSTTEAGKDVFKEVSLYWGNIKVEDNTVLITNLDRIMVFSLTEMNKPNIELTLEFAEGETGYMAAATKLTDGYAVLYWTDSEEGIAIFDTAGNLVKKSPFRRWQINDEGDYLSHFIDYNYDVAQQTAPFIFKETRLSAAENSEDILLIDTLICGNSTKMLYNCNTEVLYGNGHYTQLAEGEDTYTVYNYIKVSPYYGNEDYYNFVAAKETGGVITGSVFFEDDDCSAMSRFGYELAKGETDSQLLYTVAPTGMTLTIDFDSKTVEKQFTITEDMLGDELATSRDKRYSLYSYAFKGYGNVQAYHVVLKDNKTKDIKYLDEIGIFHDYSIGETGFFSNGDVYIINDNNFKIFTTDMATQGADFCLADNFPLGIYEDEKGSLSVRYLCAARRDPDDGSFIAVYYQHPYSATGEERYRYEDGVFLDATYMVGLFDAQGNLHTSYDTGIRVPDGIFEINMYLKGDILTLEMTYKDFDEILWKGTVDITTGQYKEIKAYRKPTQW